MAHERVLQLNALQRHRGPDDTVEAPAASFLLGNTRLAIQDPTSDGNQPFRSADGRFVCVFNGEIYNFLELIEDHRLEPANRCDGAIIPELWSRFGFECLRHLRGMYALAVVDREDDVLFLSRDPFGIKPLYLRWFTDFSMAFASETRALARIGSAPPIRNDALARFFHLGALAPDMSPFEGIDAVPPDTVVIIEADGEMATRLISKATQPPLGRALAVSQPGLAEGFRDSVDVHLRSDVPTALLLSGGVDSAAIASAARGLDRDLHCVTVAALGADDESDAAAATARHYEHDHAIVEAAIDDAAVKSYFSSMQVPSIDGLNTFLVSKAVREAGYKVALSGLGGDEALGGYAHYRFLRRLPMLRALEHVPRAILDPLAVLAVRASARGRSGKVERLLREGRKSAWDLALLQREVLSPTIVRSLTGTDPASLPYFERPEELSGVPAFVELTGAEFLLYLQSTLLPDADAYSMSHSVELRVPFVDTSFLASVNHVALQGSVTKKRLAAALHDDFLLGLTRKAKRGFSVPMRAWIDHGPLEPFVSALQDDDAPLWSHVDKEVGRAITRRSHDRWSEVWSLAALNAWLRSLSDAGRAVA